jgi:hypothetical protein
MRTVLGGVAVLVLTAGAAGAQELEIENAAARVVVIPEARSDVQVSVTPGRVGLPQLQIQRTRAGVEIDGGLRRRIEGCNTHNGLTTVRIDGVGRVPLADLPVVTARVPLNADVSASGAVWGSIGRTNNLDLASAGCGEWRAANVAGQVEVSAAGSGGVYVGSSRSAQVSLAGSGDVRLGPVAGPLRASMAGSGDIRAVSVSGALEASIAGSGDVVVEQGRTGPLEANIVGSGDVRVPGAASLNASIMGSGDVRVGEVAGSVRRSVMGSGDVVIGR